MISDLIYLGLLNLGGIKDLQSRSIKHWQVFVFTLFILLQLIWFKHLSLFILLTFLAASLVIWVGFLYGMVGAQDVKIIALSALYNLYRHNPWWIWYVGLLAGLIDLGLWSFYYRHRDKPSPFLFSWGLANLIYYAWNSLI